MAYTQQPEPPPWQHKGKISEACRMLICHHCISQECPHACHFPSSRPHTGAMADKETTTMNPGDGTLPSQKQVDPQTKPDPSKPPKLGSFDERLTSEQQPSDLPSTGYLNTGDPQAKS